MTTATITRERPILFAARNVVAILAGTKTQTRRPIVPAPSESEHTPGMWLRLRSARGLRTRYDSNGRRKVVTRRDTGEVLSESECFLPLVDWLIEQCPYGLAGDRLWVRETWNADDIDATTWMGGGENWGPFRTIPKSRPESARMRYAADDRDWDAMDKWRPSIHMPRWASRITLEITRVRAERLQDMTEADAIAEGIRRAYVKGLVYRPSPDDGEIYPSARDAYRNNWNETYPATPWDANPWVWAIEFRRVEHDR